MKADTWPCLQPGGGSAGEFALVAEGERPHRVLIVPALFDEANKLRRLTVEVMRRLAGSGIGCVLPDLPGCNESAVPLGDVALSDWEAAAEAAAAHFGATHVLAIRGGALVAPVLPGWHYAPVRGAVQLRALLRARILAAREAGREETQETLLAVGASQGLELAGHRLSPAMLAELQAAAASGDATAIDQDTVGGSGLWLRAEPDYDRAQADALAAIVAVGLAR